LISLDDSINRHATFSDRPEINASEKEMFLSSQEDLFIAIRQRFEGDSNRGTDDNKDSSLFVINIERSVIVIKSLFTQIKGFAAVGQLINFRTQGRFDNDVNLIHGIIMIVGAIIVVIRNAFQENSFMSRGKQCDAGAYRTGDNRIALFPRPEKDSFRY
jgi:hypothetical protein